MLRRPHCCGLMIGALLVLVALVWMVRVEFTIGSGTHTAPTVRVAQAVTRLEGGCLTCHRTAADARFTLVPEAVDHAPLEDRFMAATAPTLQTNVDAQLLDLGQRILALPESGDRASTPRAQLAQVFVQAVDTTRTLRAGADPQVILGRIAAVESLLRRLENQASPYRLSRPEIMPGRLAVVVAYSTPPVAPFAGLSPGVMLFDAGAGDAWAVFDTVSRMMPCEVAYAVLRRGPPEGSLFGFRVV